MSNKVDIFHGELVSQSIFLPSLHATPVQDNFVPGSRPRSFFGSKCLKQGDWRRAAAAETDGTPVQPPGEPDFFGNIDDVHSSTSTVGQDDSAPNPILGFEAPFQFESPSRVRAPNMPQGSDGELSTPGSGGYDSPAVHFLSRPTPIMQSNNPLFVERPSALSANDDVARTLQMTPCMTTSPQLRPSRRTRESCWSSSISGGVSISINSQAISDIIATSSALATGTQSQALVTPTSSPPPSPLPALDAPSPYNLEINTPRRAIMALCGMGANADVGAADAPAAAVGSSDGRQAATPCSAPLRASADVCGTAAVDMVGKVASATPYSAAIVPEDGPSSSEPGTEGSTRKDTDAAARDTSACSSPSGHKLDDTAGPRRGVDQTPRKTARSLDTDGAKGAKAVDGDKPVAQAPAASSKPLPSSNKAQPTAEGRPVSKAESGRCGGGRRALASWAVIALVAAVAVFFLEDKPVAVLRDMGIAAPKDTWGLLSFLGQPAAGVPVRTADAADKAIAAASTVGYTGLGLPPQVPYCLLREDGCHMLGNLFQSDEQARDQVPASALTAMQERAPLVAAPPIRYEDSALSLPGTAPPAPDAENFATASGSDAVEPAVVPLPHPDGAELHIAPGPELAATLSKQSGAVQADGVALEGHSVVAEASAANPTESLADVAIAQYAAPEAVDAVAMDTVGQPEIAAPYTVEELGAVDSGAGEELALPTPVAAEELGAADSADVTGLGAATSSAAEEALAAVEPCIAPEALPATPPNMDTCTTEDEVSPSGAWAEQAVVGSGDVAEQYAPSDMVADQAASALVAETEQVLAAPDNVSEQDVTASDAVMVQDAMASEAVLEQDATVPDAIEEQGVAAPYAAEVSAAAALAEQEAAATAAEQEQAAAALDATDGQAIGPVLAAATERLGPTHGKTYGWALPLSIVGFACLAVAVLASALKRHKPTVSSVTATPAAINDVTEAEIAPPLTPSGRILKLKAGFSYGGLSRPVEACGEEMTPESDKAQRTPEPGSYVFIKNKLTYVVDNQ